MAKDQIGGASEKLIHLTHEIETLKQELLVQGEQLESEILGRKSELGRLKLEVQTLKKLLDELQPGFLQRYEKQYAVERQRFDPELDQSA
jgi:hypothetical protein